MSKIKTEEALQGIVDGLVGKINALPYERVEVATTRVGKGDEEEMVLMISDLQIGHKTPTTNADVVDERMKRLVKSTVKILSLHRKAHPINKLNVFLLGDIVHNENIGRTIDLDELECVLVEQMFQVAVPVICKALVSLEPYFPKGIDCFMVQGNHGRFDKMHSWNTNMDGVVYRFVIERMRDYKNIRFHPVYDYFYQVAKIYDWKFMLIHGDQIPMFHTLPFYGLTTRSMRLAGSIEDYDYLALGHFHSPAFLSWVRREIIMNGCFVTDDQWPLRVLGLDSVAKQVLFLVHPKQGVTARYLIRLD